MEWYEKLGYFDEVDALAAHRSAYEINPFLLITEPQDQLNEQTSEPDVDDDIDI